MGLLRWLRYRGQICRVRKFGYARLHCYLPKGHGGAHRWGQF